MYKYFRRLDKNSSLFCCKKENVFFWKHMTNWYIITIKEDLRGGINENIKGKGIQEDKWIQSRALGSIARDKARKLFKERKWQKKIHI